MFSSTKRFSFNFHSKIVCLVKSDSFVVCNVIEIIFHFSLNLVIIIFTISHSFPYQHTIFFSALSIELVVYFDLCISFRKKFFLMKIKKNISFSFNKSEITYNQEKFSTFAVDTDIASA